jgi:hypothetical protein
VEAYRHDRNMIESWNREFKEESTSIEPTSRRRMRGLGAAQFMLVLEVVQRNFARIASFFEKAATAAATPKPATGTPRRRDRDGLSDYVRYRGPKREAFLAVPDTPLRT